MQHIDALSLLGFLAFPNQAESPVTWSAGWQTRFETHGSVHSAYTAAPDCSLILRRIDGHAALELMCTPWSGMLELSSQGQAAVIDTYAARHEAKDFPLPGSGLRDVLIRVLNTRHAESQDTQIWLHRLLLERRPDWVARHKRLTSAISFVDGNYGAFLVLEKDRPVSYDIKHYGGWGDLQVAQFRKLVRPGTTVADVGANLGHHTVVLSGLVGKQGAVLAFEPQKRVHRILQANLALNLCDNVEAYEFALGSEDADAQMLPQDYDSVEWNVGGLSVATANGKLEFREGGLPIKLRRLDDIARGRNLDFIKSDAQGFDFAVFLGGVEVLKNDKPIIVAEVAPSAMKAAGHDYLDFYRFLQDLGYAITDPDRPDFAVAPRTWSGRSDEEWDILAVHTAREDHLARARAT